MNKARPTSSKFYEMKHEFHIQFPAAQNPIQAGRLPGARNDLEFICVGITDKMAY